MLPEGRQRGAGVADRHKPARMLLARRAHHPDPLLHPGVVHPQHGPVRHHRVRPRGRQGDDVAAHFALRTWVYVYMKRTATVHKRNHRRTEQQTTLVKVTTEV